MAAPSAPSNVSIISSRDPSVTVGSGPDIVLIWDQATPGGAPILGYRVFFGVDPNAFSNYMDFSINDYPIGVYATFTATIPGGTIPNPVPAVTYYFAVQTFDDGTEVDVVT